MKIKVVICLIFLIPIGNPGVLGAEANTSRSLFVASSMMPDTIPLSPKSQFQVELEEEIDSLNENRKNKVWKQPANDNFR